MKRPLAHSPTVTGHLPAPQPVVAFGWGKCLLIGTILCLVILGVAFLGRWQLMASDKKHAAESAALRTDLGGKVDAALVKQAELAGLIQSIGQALNTLAANGTLTPEQATAIGAAVAANQAAKAGTKAQAGTTPGIPGSRGGGGTSVTPGVPGSAIRPVASQTTPPPHSSDTSRCLATINVPAILKLDGTVCPP